MAILTFPTTPTNGQLYPLAPVAGQNQYQWEAASNTWRLLGTATGVAAGVYGNSDNIPQITIDATGRITLATNIPIGQTYVKTNNPSAYNSYIWPNADGAAGQFLQTDGANTLSWVASPFTNYWQLTGSTLEPISNSYDLALRNPANEVTFLVDGATGTLELTAPGVGATFIQFEPDNTLSSITVANSPTSAKPFLIRGEQLELAAYGNSFLNTPSNVTLTQGSLASTVDITTQGRVQVNSGTANSFYTPPTRGGLGEYLSSNGDGTTAWISSPWVNYWQRTGTIVSPAIPGDSVEVTDTSSISRVILDPTGKVKAATGLQSIVLDSNAAAGVSSVTSFTSTVNPGNIVVQGNKVILQPWGGIFTNPATTFTVSNPGNIELKAVIGGINTTLFTINDEGDLSTGRYIDNLAPALFVEGLNGNVTVGGRLTVNAGVPIPGAGNSYTFPPNRGVTDYALFTNADGTTRWDSVNNVTGYWTESGGATDLFPTAAGQNVLIRSGASAVSISLDADGYITALGGDAINPTFGFFGNRTGFYGGTTDQINIGVNGTKVAKFDDNFFYCYEDINFIGAATNPGADSVFENTNTELLFSASTSSTVSKDIVFENSQNSQVAKFASTGDFTLPLGGASIGSSSIVTYVDTTNLAVGNTAANQAGLVKFVSAFNGGDGVELTQDAASGDFEIRMDHTATPVVTINATDTDLTTTLTVAGDTTLNGELFVPAPTVPPTATSTGAVGQIAWDANYIYVCIATNSWKRTPITTW